MKQHTQDTPIATDTEDLDAPFVPVGWSPEDAETDPVKLAESAHMFDFLLDKDEYADTHALIICLQYSRYEMDPESVKPSDVSRLNELATMLNGTYADAHKFAKQRLGK